MKGLIKRNQLIITAMATLVAIAGYVSFADDGYMNEKEKNTSMIEGNAENNNDMDGREAKVDVIENEVTVNVTAQDETINLDTDAKPGEAILVNAKGTIDTVAEARLNRQSVRAESLEKLSEIVNNKEIKDDDKKSAIDKYTQMTSASEKEQLAESKMTLYGYENSLVSMIDGHVDLMLITEGKNVKIDEITKIEESLKEIFGVSAADITITVLNNNENE